MRTIRGKARLFTCDPSYHRGFAGAVTLLEPYPGFYWEFSWNGHVSHFPGWWQRLHLWLFGHYWEKK